MAVRKRESKKTKGGFVYETYFTYKNDEEGTKRYSKSGFLTKKAAQDHELEVRSAIMKTGDGFRNRKTFNQVFLEYMEVEGRSLYAPATWHYYMNTHGLYVKDTKVAKMEISKIRYKHLQSLFTELRFLGQATLKNMKKVFSVTFKYALKNEYVVSNPVPLVIARSEVDTSRKSFELTDSQFSELCMRVVQVDKHTPNQEETIWNNFCYLVLLQLGWYLGVRISEGLAFVKSDFDFVSNTVKIQRRLEYQRLKKDDIYLTDRMKTKGSAATLPIPIPLSEFLQLWFKENPYELLVCDISGHLIHPSSVNFRFLAIGRAMGIDFHFHILRHSKSSSLSRAGIPPATAMKLMRHTQYSTTLGYTHASEDDMREATNKLYQDNNKD